MGLTGIPRVPIYRHVIIIAHCINNLVDSMRYSGMSPRFIGEWNKADQGVLE
jgi:hypothetical protein